jgi:pimeloyl-ACP methyl ester carboxylesterase
MPKLPVGNQTVHYQQAGTGSDIVLLHGLGANLACWYFSVLPALSRCHRVTAYDLRGHGLSTVAASGYTTSALAADLAAILESLGIRRAHLVGHSYGAAIALRTALEPPSRRRVDIASVVAADAYIPGFQRVGGKAARMRTRRARYRLRTAGVWMPASLPRVAYALVEDLARVPDPSRVGGSWQWADPMRLGKRWHRLKSETTLLRDIEDSRGVTEHSLSSLRIPVLATCGEHSVFVPTTRRLQTCLPTVRVAVFPGAGHVHPVLRPEEFAGEVLRFVADVDTGAEALASGRPSTAGMVGKA